MKPVSVGYIGIRDYKKYVISKDKMVLVIGNGDIAKFLAQISFICRNMKQVKIYLCSRTLAHAGNVQKEFQEIEIISYEQRYGDHETM